MNKIRINYAPMNTDNFYNHLTKWQKTMMEVRKEYREAGKYISFGDVSRIASERYTLACIEEDNKKYTNRRRSSRLQKKAAKASTPAPAPTLAEPICNDIYDPESYYEYWNDCDSIDSPLTDEELDAALYELEKNADY